MVSFTRSDKYQLKLVKKKKSIETAWKKVQFKYFMIISLPSLLADLSDQHKLHYKWGWFHVLRKGTKQILLHRWHPFIIISIISIIGDVTYYKQIYTDKQLLILYIIIITNSMNTNFVLYEMYISKLFKKKYGFKFTNIK